MRARWQLVLNDSESCLLAKCISNLVVFLIVLSTLSFVIESLPAFHVDGGPELQVVLRPSLSQTDSIS